MRDFAKAVAISAVVTLSLVTTRSASAQSIYVGAVGFADVKNFDSTRLLGRDFSLSGTGGGGGVRIGGFLTPLWSLEFAVDAGSRTETSLDRESPYISIPVRTPLDFRQSTQFTAFTTSVGFHPAARGRIQFGFRAGYSIIRGSYKSTYPRIGLPEPLFKPGQGLTFDESSLPLILPPPIITTATNEQTDTSAAIVLGAEMSFAMTTRLSVAPEVRVSTFQDVLMIRPGAGIRWKF